MVVAGLAVLCAGTVKWRRYAKLRERIAYYSRFEGRLLAEYEQISRIPGRCGNQRRLAEAYLGVAAEHRRLREDCEREIRRIW